MFDRNTIVGVDFLVIGLVVSALGYIGVQSVSIAALGFSIAIIGALILLVIPESVPQDAFRALLKDSITNVEIILEETQLKNKAYFIPVKSEDNPRGEIRAFIPIDAPVPKEETSIASNLNISMLVEYIDKSPRRFITSYGDLQGLLLVPPGNDIVRLAKVETGMDIEETLRSVLVDFADLAGSVLVVEEKGKSEDYEEELETERIPEKSLIRIRISRPRLGSESPYFNECLGTPISCIAACIVTAAKRSPVRLVREIYDPSLIRLTLQLVA